METVKIKELQSQDEIIQAFPVMKQLRTHLDENTYVELVTEAMEEDMYRLPYTTGKRLLQLLDSSL